MNIVVIGDGGLSDEIIWTAQELGHNVVACVACPDKKSKSETHDWNWFRLHEWDQAIIAVGDPLTRRYLADTAHATLGYLVPWATLIHPKAIIGPRCKIGEGSIIQAGAVITTDVTIGEHVVLNLNVTVGHNTMIEDFCVVNPGANISGNVALCERVLIGTGAQVLQKLVVHEGAKIGAGACLTKHALPNKTYVGVPAKLLAINTLKEEE